MTRAPIVVEYDRPLEVADVEVLDVDEDEAVLMGKPQADRDYNDLARQYLEGELFLDELITQRLPLDRVNETFATMAEGAVARSLIVYD